MAEGRRALNTDEYKNLETDDAGALFWKGKKVRLGGWTIGERIAVVAVIATFLGVVINATANYNAIKTLVEHLVKPGQQTVPVPAKDAPTKDK
jgi:hypothetical protein